MADLDPETLLHVTLSGDVFLKSRRTQRRFIQRVRSNLTEAVQAAGYVGEVRRRGAHRFQLTPDPEQMDAVRLAARSVFGISSVDSVRAVPFGTMDELARRVGEMASARVRGRTFAARRQGQAQRCPRLELDGSRDADRFGALQRVRWR